jgi:hypothetical protein
MSEQIKVNGSTPLPNSVSQDEANIMKVSSLLNVSPSQVKIINGQLTSQMGFYWGKWELIRELEQNELDASLQMMGKSSLVQPTYTIDSLKIEDQFGGFDFEDFFLMGDSEKRNDENMRGLQATGLKFVTSMCVRNNWTIIIKSKGWACIPLKSSLGKKDNINYYVIDTNDNLNGISIEVIGIGDCAEEMNGYLSTRFIKSNDAVITSRSGEGSILSSISGKVFVKDIYVKDIQSQFSYNLQGAEVRNLGQDRNNVSDDVLYSKISRIISNVEDVKEIQKILKGIKNEDIENKLTYSFNIKNDGAWIEAWNNEMGEKAVINDMLIVDNEKAARIAYEGYTPQQLTTNGYITSQLKMSGIKSATQVLKEWSDKLVNKSKYTFDKIAPRSQVSMTMAINMLTTWESFDNIEVNKMLEEGNLMFYDMNEKDNELGYYSTNENKIYISTKIMEAGVIDIAMTLAHEYIHYKYGYDDSSRSFEQMLQTICIAFMKKSANKKYLDR